MWRPAQRSTVESNAQVTAHAGILLLCLLGLEGATILSIRALLLPHFFLGLLVVPPLLLKLASTGHRFVRYYLGDPAYRAAGPPELILRLVAPLVVVSTVALLATGIELWLFGLRFGEVWITLHKASFVVWFVVTAIHVLGHVLDTPRLALDDLRQGGSIGRLLRRRSVVLASLAAGVVLAFGVLVWHTPFVASGGG